MMGSWGLHDIRWAIATGLAVGLSAAVHAGAAREEVHIVPFAVPLSPAMLVLDLPGFDTQSDAREILFARVEVTGTARAHVTVENESTLPAPDIAMQLAGVAVLTCGPLATTAEFSRVELADAVVEPSDGVPGSGDDFWDFGSVTVAVKSTGETTRELGIFATGQPIAATLDVEATVVVSMSTPLTVEVDDFGIDGTVMVTYGYQSTCRADLDEDGEVGFTELLRVLGAWGCTACIEDLDASGTVDPADLLTVLVEWGVCP